MQVELSKLFLGWRASHKGFGCQAVISTEIVGILKEDHTEADKSLFN